MNGTQILYQEGSNTGCKGCIILPLDRLLQTTQLTPYNVLELSEEAYQRCVFRLHQNEGGVPNARLYCSSAEAVQWEPKIHHCGLVVC